MACGGPFEVTVEAHVSQFRDLEPRDGTAQVAKAGVEQSLVGDDAVRSSGGEDKAFFQIAPASEAAISNTGHPCKVSKINEPKFNCLCVTYRILVKLVWNKGQYSMGEAIESTKSIWNNK